MSCSSNEASRGVLPAGRGLLSDQRSVSADGVADVSTLKTDLRRYTAQAVQGYGVSADVIDFPDIPQSIGVAL